MCVCNVNWNYGHWKFLNLKFPLKNQYELAPSIRRIPSNDIQNVNDQGAILIQQGRKPLYNAMNPSFDTVSRRQSIAPRYNRPLQFNRNENSYGR